MSKNQILIAVDGGGSGCRCAVGTPENGVLATAQGGAANIASHFDSSIQNIRTTIDAALKSAGLPQADGGLAVAHFGLAGAETQKLRQMAAAAFNFAKVTVTSDVDTALAGALGQNDGFLLSIGTGTIAACQRGADIRKVGGWGFALSDQASGAWLGKRALEQSLLALDGIVATSVLAQSILDELGSGSGIFGFAAGASPNDYAAFAPRICDSADQDDEIALQLMHEGAAYLNAALQQLGYRPDDRLCLTGGVGGRYAPYLRKLGIAPITSAAGTALDGAFWLAAEAAKR